MLTTRPRRSTSAVSYSESEATELRGHLDEVRLLLHDNGTTPTVDTIQKATVAVKDLATCIGGHERPARMRDAFRNFEGFALILSLLRRVSTLLDSLESSPTMAYAVVHYVSSLLQLLSDVLTDHWGNCKFFRTRVEEDGWAALETALKEFLEKHREKYKKTWGVQQMIFDGLVTHALRNKLCLELFHTITTELGPTLAGYSRGPDAYLARSEEIVREHVEFGPRLYVPQFLWLLFSLWSFVTMDSPRPEGHPGPSVPMVLRTVAESSTQNLTALHGTQVLSKALPLLCRPEPEELLRVEIEELCTCLLSNGTGQIADANFLFNQASHNQAAAEVLSSALGLFNPPCIHFDLSLYGYSSIELPVLGREFPPSSSVYGYTLTLWIQIVRFDPQSHTTLFGAFDASQKCFVLVYIEKDTKNLILQTSITSPRPSVRFKSFVFEEGKWNHVAIVHRRPTLTSSSRASLFINGEFIEQAKSHFPSTPPPAPTSTKDSNSPGPKRKYQAVQAFLGTPQDLATKHGSKVAESQWRLASAYLINEALSDDLIAVHAQLGPRYYGNFQDCLGSFMTYQASTVLNLRNENLHPGKEEKSDIVGAIRSKSSALVPESKYLLDISPMTVFDENASNTLTETVLSKNLSKTAARNLQNATRNGRAAIAINGAIPSINEALLHRSGMALLTGSPTVVIPQALDDATWRMGGCAAIVLGLVDAAKSHDDLLRALGILFATIKSNWRNSEAMERDNGFGVLASLLSAKLTDPAITQPQEPNGNERDGNKDAGPKSRQRDLHFDILTMILDFVGYNASHPEDSLIINPLAYRVLLVDMDLWRSASPSAQDLFYEQFVAFAAGSKYHTFNARRFARMRLVRKWLDALKVENVYSEECLAGSLKAFKALLGGVFSADTHRAITLYTTYAVHRLDERTPLPRSARSVKRKATAPAATNGSQPPSSFNDAFLRASGKPALTLQQVGVRVLEMYVDQLCQPETENVKKFSRTITNRWLLHLLADEDLRVVALAAKLLARVLVVAPPAYAQKFDAKTGGFVLLRHRLRRHWTNAAVWRACLAILFGRDAAKVDFGAKFNLAELMTAFSPVDLEVRHPGALGAVYAMLQTGLKNVVRDQEDPNSPPAQDSSGDPFLDTPNRPRHNRTRSKSLYVDTKSKANGLEYRQNNSSEGVTIIQTVTRFLADLHTNSAAFRDFAATSTYTQDLIGLLFPIVVSTDTVSPETELHSRDSALTFNGSDVIIRPLSQTSQRPTPIVRTASVESTPSPSASKKLTLKRGSSFVLITAEEPKHQPSSARLDPVASPKSKDKVLMHLSHALVENILEMIVAVFTDMILARKDFAGIGLFLKVPPGFQEHQAYFASSILQHVLSNLGTSLKLHQNILAEPRVLTNLHRFCLHLDETVYEGWFINGADPALDFLGEVLEHLQRPDVSQLKSVRLCSELIAGMRTVLSRICLLRLSELNPSTDEKGTVLFLRKLTYWQAVLFSAELESDTFCKLFSYLLYDKLISANSDVREVAIDLWRTFLVHKHGDGSGVLTRIIGNDHDDLSAGFDKIMELDNDAFSAWVDDHRQELDAIFFGSLSSTWESFVSAENRRTQDGYQTRVAKRRDKLRQWAKEGLANDEIIRRHEAAASHWRVNIGSSELLKHQRSIQDAQDAEAFHQVTWAAMRAQLHRPCGFLEKTEAQKWQLDLTEGRSRMRLRLIPDRKAHLQNYQAKGHSAKEPAKAMLTVNTRKASAAQAGSPLVSSPTSVSSKNKKDKQPPEDSDASSAHQQNGDIDDDYEMVDEPDAADAFEDKNRKVMRSLQRAERLESVHNVSRIVGLEACAALLILGASALYLMDDFFQRADGEIVDAWQAPADERDAYMQMIAGREPTTKVERPPVANRETRSWRWEEVLSISKRRFLFREVGIEIFFLDGRSYLLAFSMPKYRDNIYQKLLAKLPNVNSNAVLNSPEHRWRIEALRTPEDGQQSLSSRFTSVFAQCIASPATKKWIKGEMSNFAYLMHVNTMAGRTFNDLTQYPVFPWVLADYTSEELDLANPRTFRDLTKPMGCQTAERQMEFRERYQTFAEMGDGNSPPFHYGTHYSSAMIVTSYLIRLEPFVQSYLLLQGGSFDHADRLFYSIEKAWISASRDNMTDVRELIPEFYYLPEMLVNANGFDFGARQGDGGRIDNVVLPLWAKGDPKIFVAKQREALESDYVSRHLHHWIDLVFGHKQRGEAALEATNIFHHLSYHGARDLDAITDPVERRATIGIIHNFGQTPHQVFHRSHPAREDSRLRAQRLDTLAETLTKLPFPLLERPERVTSLTFNAKTGRLLCASPRQLHVPPAHDTLLEWGFVDGSVRLFAPDATAPLAVFEHLHQTPISAALFADARTLVTAGEDGVVSLWALSGPPAAKHVDLTLKGSLFGHAAPVAGLAVSLSLSTLVSCAADGSVLLWDLNRRDLVRELARPGDKPPVDCARVHDAAGTVALARGAVVALHTLNGELLLEQHACVEGDEAISCLAFYEGSSTEHVQRTLLFTGHRRGAVNVWAVEVHGDGFVLAHVHRMVHADASGVILGTAITAVLPRALTVYTGDDDGRVYQWDCIQRQDGR